MFMILLFLVFFYWVMVSYYNYYYWLVYVQVGSFCEICKRLHWLRKSRRYWQKGVFVLTTDGSATVMMTFGVICACRWSSLNFYDSTRDESSFAVKTTTFGWKKIVAEPSVIENEKSLVYAGEIQIFIFSEGKCFWTRVSTDSFVCKGKSEIIQVALCKQTRRWEHYDHTKTVLMENTYYVHHECDGQTQTGTHSTRFIKG